MTIEEARKKIVESIVHIYDKNEANNIADLLMENITRLPRAERILKRNETLSLSQKNSLSQFIGRLQNHEPVQYIINEAWFAGMKFYIDKNVLIPRPETEELVDWVIKEFRIQDLPAGSQGKEFRILDVGTGSGCIAIALKKKLPHAEVWACDVSEEALNVARINADSLNATVDFVPLDFLDKEQRKQLPHIDIVVSNPPYVPQKDKSEMKKIVIDHEPEIALFVPDEEPLIFYSTLADFGKEKLNRGGSVYVEIHEELGEQVKNLFHSKGYSSVELKKDLQGKNRMIKVSLESDK
jgi:release factor glutamine methyltransferase